MTNYEKIKSMSKEELSEYIFDLGNGSEYCYGHCAFQNMENCPNKTEQCLIGVQKWLDMEIEV